MQAHCTDGMEEKAPKINATMVVMVVMLILIPTSSMVSLIRRMVSLLGSVRKYSPVIIKVSSRPTPNMTKGRICVKLVKGTPMMKHSPNPAEMDMRMVKTDPKPTIVLD
jgi:hypothetical protein